MEKIAIDNALDLAIDLDVPREMVLQRLSGRRLCRDCGTNYTSTGYERRPWLCDVCGGDIIHREDDTEEAINRRLDDYESQTRPLIDFYESRGLLVTVSGVGTPDEVLIRLISAIEGRRRGPGAGPIVGG